MKIKNRLARSIDENGYFIEDVFTSNTSSLIIDKPIPEGFFKPRWVNGEWVDEEAYKREGLNSVAYKQLRAREYPPIEDFIDALVKGDDEQKQEYIQKCLDVKAKYPKGVFNGYVEP